MIRLDADALFASVEQAADPKLRGKPVAVGGERRGIIASASYEARKLGIYTPMPTARARKLCAISSADKYSRKDSTVEVVIVSSPSDPISRANWLTSTRVPAKNANPSPVASGTLRTYFSMVAAAAWFFPCSIKPSIIKLLRTRA